MTRPPEPSATPDTTELLISYLDYYRRDISAVLAGLEPEQAASSAVPSGWTPAGLANHLWHVERRWFRWGFAAEPVDDPWGDHVGGAEDNPEWAPADAPVADVTRRWLAEGDHTATLLRAHPLSQKAAAGGRFHDPATAPDLRWIVMHVLQEYARHAGHLDIVAEVMGDPS